MTCTELSAKIEARMPQAQPIEIARMCTLMCAQVEELSEYENEACFDSTWDEVSLRLNAAGDQHEAMTMELQDLTKSDPRRFTPCLLYTSPSPRDLSTSRMPSSA